MRPIAIVGYARTGAAAPENDEVELVRQVVDDALTDADITRDQLGFICSGSCDLLIGRPFSFVSAVDGVGMWPPKSESHVEMDGAWALYEAFLRLHHGDIDAALVYSFGKGTAGDLNQVLTLQLDPYRMAPLAIDAVGMAGLQARAFVEAHDADPALADIARPAWSDGAAAVVLAAGDLAERCKERPAWIRGIEQRIEAHSLGARDLTQSVSTAQAAAALDLSGVQAAELHASFAYQQPMLTRALGLGEGVALNPATGALDDDPCMSTGLIRLGEAARRIHTGDVDVALAHASSGPCMQHNLVAVLEAR